MALRQGAILLAAVTLSVSPAWAGEPKLPKPQRQLDQVPLEAGRAANVRRHDDRYEAFGWGRDYEQMLAPWPGRDPHYQRPGEGLEARPLSDRVPLEAGRAANVRRHDERYEAFGWGRDYEQVLAPWPGRDPHYQRPGEGLEARPLSDRVPLEAGRAANVRRHDERYEAFGWGRDYEQVLAPWPGRDPHYMSEPDVPEPASVTKRIPLGGELVPPHSKD